MGWFRVLVGVFAEMDCQDFHRINAGKYPVARFQNDLPPKLTPVDHRHLAGRKSWWG